MGRMHKPDSKLSPDQQENVGDSVEPQDWNVWAAASIVEARVLLQVTTVDLFEAGRLGLDYASSFGLGL